MSEKFAAVRKRSLCEAKNTQASNSARRGPKAKSIPLLRAPARIEAERGVPAVHALHRLVGDEGHAGVDRARYLLTGLRVLDSRVDTERRHLQRILLRRRGEHSRLDVSHARTTPVHR